MAKLKDRIKTALDESRMLILGAQVLLGLQFKSALEKGFEKLPQHSQYLKLGALCLMLLAIALLMAPGAYHRIVEDGEDHEDVHSFTTRVMCFALLPFAFALGIDLYVATEGVAGSVAALLVGTLGGLTALFFWYGLELMRRSRRKPEIREKRAMSEENQEKDEGTKLKDKIEQVLTECRVVLPGAQALLGFQFIAMMMEGFEKLPTSSKYIHLVSLFLVALSVILLMTPAAYHRLVEKGENTEHFHSFASRMLIASMIPLALGLCSDFYVVTLKVTESRAVAIPGAAFMLLFFYGLWFGFTLYKRSQHERGAQARASKSKEKQLAT
ncbi:MAG TPA: DUF6328 family protein [Pyrinomonadaceae bacterium]|jgi:hypothetical protein